jgi:hypothetical protein
MQTLSMQPEYLIDEMFDYCYKVSKKKSLEENKCECDSK